jgi:hypothetical protein
MQRSMYALGGAIVAVIVVAVVVAAQVPAQAPAPPERPGLPSAARMYVLNHDRTEAIPVTVEGVGDPVPVVVTNIPPVTLMPTTIVSTKTIRQRWEYRRVTIPAGSNLEAALNSAGDEGWEVVGSVGVGANQAWLLKRPK